MRSASEKHEFIQIRYWLQRWLLKLFCRSQSLCDGGMCNKRINNGGSVRPVCKKGHACQNLTDIFDDNLRPQFRTCAHMINTTCFSNQLARDQRTCQRLLCLCAMENAIDSNPTVHRSCCDKHTTEACFSVAQLRLKH